MQNIIRWLLIILAVVPIVLWHLVTSGALNILSIIDKPVEVVLIVLLLID